MGFLNLFAISSMPVLKVLLVSGLGSYLALDRIDILGEDARKHLNNIVFFVFNPALVSSNLAKTITYESMVQMWFMPFNILITFIIGSALGWVVIQITRPPPHLHGLVIGCCAAGNLGNMLLIIIPAVCKERGSPFGDSDVCSEYGMGYASLSMAVSFSDKIKQHLDMLLQLMNLKRLFAPSTTGVIAGFVVGLVPQIRKLLIGETAPVHVIQDTALLLGDGAIPAVTLVMGGNLLRGLKGSEIQKSIILGIIIVRYVALPLLGIVIVKGATRFGLVHHNPLYEFVLLLQFALPPAMNIGTMSQLFGAGESECSVIMLWCYALASITLTLWSTLFLWLVA
ncbi:protein PIN-LIKES 4-like isoform X2 [Olea europaea var. sylvestris]|uniref:protein PIN-LIKES 4-like isoform X2 n=1 Tax=Olea europaea var. sylvestris TaxID=158386 RepID=UPI000C1CE406|nr:protein PIN-LIKES 4-like isoform X2 [Olea europaea var. sylvestris]